MKKQLQNYQQKCYNIQSLEFKFKSLVKASCFVLIFLMLSATNIYSQDCQAIITVKNNVESINTDGRIYFMELKNTGLNDLSLSFSVENNNTCVNPDNTPGSSNVNLNAAVLTEDNNPIVEKIVLKSLTSFKFLVHVTAPENTPINHWNCCELKAISDECPDMPTSMILNTYIPDLINGE